MRWFIDLISTESQQSRPEKEGKYDEYNLSLFLGYITFTVYVVVISACPKYNENFKTLILITLYINIHYVFCYI
mgnify:CR=1 FL=1